MIYRKVNKDEYIQLAAIHQAAFKNFFLTDLGFEFLNAYYKVVLSSSLSITVCALDESNKIYGFASGSQTTGSYHSKLLLSGFFVFLTQTLRLILKRPMAILRMVKNLKKSPHPNDNGDYSELLVIAVLPEAEGQGIGKGLLSVYEKEAFRTGFRRVALTTDFNNNDAVVAFYKKCGYEIYYDFITYPRRHMYKMIKSLNIEN